MRFSSNSESIFCLALVIPHPAPNWYLCLCLVAESAALNVSSWIQISNCPWSCCRYGFRWISRWSTAGQRIQLSPFPGAQALSAAICWLRAGLGGQYFRVCCCNLDYGCCHVGFSLPNKASRASKPQDYTSHLLFSQQKVTNERISAVNSWGYFIIYLYFYTIHLGTTWNFRRNQQALWYFFFCLEI